MARVTKDHLARRQEFLDVARELFYMKGYEETSVNDILKILDLSKGTFYHYFKSKEELLDELVVHLTKDILDIIDKYIDDPAIDAITKLNKIYEISGSYKAANKDLIMTLMRTMYSDKNIRMRLKMNRYAMEVIAPIMVRIINQGIEEGVFNTNYPEDMGEFIFGMGFGLGEKVSQLILGIDEHPENLDKLNRTYDMYQNAIERLLGAPVGSIQFQAKEILAKILS
ncbi:TetR/AcrR family transcriptional regulator [Candidatus Neomarinimicrobiota bacterium]